MNKRILLIYFALVLATSLSGCGGGAVMALSAAGGAVSIAKDVFDIDVDIHTLLGQPKPTTAAATPTTARTAPVAH